MDLRKSYKNKERVIIVRDINELKIALGNMKNSAMNK